MTWCRSADLLGRSLSLAVEAPSSDHNPVSEHNVANYRGKNLLFLMLAIGAPAAFLYLRLVFGYVASQGQLGRNQLAWLSRWSNIALALFFLVQLASARYVQRLLKFPTRFFGIALQYLAVLLFCGLLSVIGAVLLEAFGYTLFLRVRHAHGL